jgi:hypothetical protein
MCPTVQNWLDSFAVVFTDNRLLAADDYFVLLTLSPTDSAACVVPQFASR